MSYFPTLRRPRINLDTPLATPIRAVPASPAPSYHTVSPGPGSPAPAYRSPLFSRPAQPVSEALTRSQVPPATQHPVAAPARRQTHSSVQPSAPPGTSAPVFPPARSGSTVNDLETFLRQTDTGPYPVMPHVNSQPQSGVRRPVSDPARSTNAQAGEGPTVVERRKGQRMRINLHGLNRLPTISSHASQEGTEVADSTRASRVPSTRSRRSQRVETEVTDARKTETVAPNLATDLLGAEIARSTTHSSRAMQAVNPNVASTAPQATGRMHRSKSSRRSRRETCPCRPPTPPPKDEPRAVAREETRAARDDTRRSIPKVDRAKERKTKTKADAEDDHAAQWVLYDEEGNIKRIWKLEYSSDKIKAHETPRRPTKRERKLEGGAGVSTSRVRAADVQVETWASRVEEARAVIDEGAEWRAREARTVVSEITQVTQAVSRITTSDDVAYSHGIFEAQEHIASLEAEQDSIRAELRNQAQRMYLLPHDQMQGALQERVELKGVLTFIQEDIEGWKEVIEVLQRNLREE